VNSAAHASPGPADATPVSPCDDAYARLVSVSEEHERLLDRLFKRLDNALSDPLPQTAQNGPVPVAEKELPRSELHGRLLSAMQRVRQQNTALSDILDRLTV
jgi:hypothetical protein